MNTPALSDLSSESSLYVLFIWCLVTDNIQQDAIIYPANTTVPLQCSRHGFVRNTGTRWGRVGRAPTGRLETLEALAESPITVPCPCPAGPRGITSETSESLSGESERSRKSSPAVVAGELPCTAGTNDYWRLIFFAITYGGIQERVRMSARACTAYQPGTGGW